MQAWLESWFPDVMASPDRFFKSIGETLLMTGWAGSLMLVIGLALGVVLVITRPHGVLENRWVYGILDKAINLLRSIPFVILSALLMNVTKFIMGTKIGVRGVIVPLVVGSAPFFARQVETALVGVPSGLVEAAKAMGSTPGTGRTLPSRLSSPRKAQRVLGSRSSPEAARMPSRIGRS